VLPGRAARGHNWNRRHWEWCRGCRLGWWPRLRCWPGVMSCNTHVTLLANLGQFLSCHNPVTPLALVPPWNPSALEAPLSQLHTDSRDSWNLVPCSNWGITNATLNTSLSSLVPVPVPVPILVPVPVHVPT